MRSLFLLSLWLGAIVLVPSGAHLLEMPHKLLMTRDAYLSVQQIYRGWALFGVPIVAKIICDAGLAALLWRQHRAAAVGAVVSALSIAAGLVVFFIWVQPGNIATANWTVLPPDWQTLRQSWEGGHAAIAGLTLIAFGAISYVAMNLVRRR